MTNSTLIDFDCFFTKSVYTIPLQRSKRKKHAITHAHTHYTTSLKKLLLKHVQKMEKEKKNSWQMCHSVVIIDGLRHFFFFSSLYLMILQFSLIERCMCERTHLLSLRCITNMICHRFKNTEI